MVDCVRNHTHTRMYAGAQRHGECRFERWRLTPRADFKKDVTADRGYGRASLLLRASRVRAMAAAIFHQ
jgi:hypothetical protein